MFGLGTTELAIILVIALVIFGAGKLPQIGGALGKGIKDFKKEMDNPDETIAVDADSPEEKQTTDV